MAVVEEGPQGPSYSKVIAHDIPNEIFKGTPFEPSTELRNILWEENSSKEKPMEVDPYPNHTKEIPTWEPGKCVLQASMTPKYVINTPILEDQNKYM